MNSNIDKLHGDEGIEYLTPEAEVAIERRTAELIAGAIADRGNFHEILAGIEPTDIEGPLHRALMRLDRACLNDQIALDAIRAALSHIQRMVYNEACSQFFEQFRAQAERELFETEEA